MFLLKYFFYFSSLPILLIFDLISYFFSFKLCEINVSRLGHATVYVEGFLLNKKYFNNDEFKNHKIFFYFSHPIINKQITKMIRRVLPIYGPSFILSSLCKALRFWNKKKYILEFKYSLKSNHIQNRISEIYKKPNLYFIEKELLEAKKLLKKFGVEKNDKWICIHNRDSAFLDKNFPNKNWNYHSFRYFSVNNLLDAAEYFANKGFYVFRMGAIQKEKLKSNNQKIIDYAFSEIKCDLLDIYILANCEFYFGGESGPSDIAFTFLRPCYGVNFPPTYLYMSRPHLPWIFIFKRLRDIRNNKLLSLRQIYNNGLNGVYDSAIFKEKNFELIENSRVTIKEFSVEALKDYNGELIENNSDIYNQKTFWDIYYEFNTDNRQNKIHPKVSPNFIRKNIDLL